MGWDRGGDGEVGRREAGGKGGRIAEVIGIEFAVV